MPPVIEGRRGRYRVESELGSGGVGVVYSGRSATSGQKVAIKVLRDPRADADTRRRFEQEAALGATFSHPNVVSVLDTGVHDGCAFMVMDLVEGETLEALLRRGAIPREAGVIVVARLARALDAAHKHGIVHRDVKPSNVIVTGAGEPVLMDFGFAKDLTSGLDLTGEWVVGTPNFMAPEQVTKKPITARVDIHALGVLLYVIATGKLPYHGKDTREAFELIMNAAPVPPRKLVPEVSVELEAIILRCLEKVPANRYATAGDLAKALDGLIAQRLATGKGRAARSPVPLLALGGVALVSVFGAAGFVLFRTLGDGPPPAPVPASQPVAPPTAPPPTGPLPPTVATASKNVTTEEEVLRGAAAEIAAFRIRGAIAYLESATQTSPRSGALKTALARALVLAGRRADALRVASEVMDSGGRDPIDAECRMILQSRSESYSSQAPEGWEPLPEGWEPLHGGEWFEREGTLLGRGNGTGPFWLAGLLRTAGPPSESYRVSVDVELGDKGYPLPYAGIIFGARSPADFFAAYVFDAEKESGDRLDPKEVQRHHDEHGSAIKWLRVARVVGGRWDMRGQFKFVGADTGFLSIAIESKGRRSVTIEVEGTREEIQLDRGTSGRVGVLKYYDTAAHFRRFTVTER